MRQHATILTLWLSLAATAAFAGDGPAGPPAPAPAIPPTPATPPSPDYGAASTVPSSPNIDEDALRARVEATVRREERAAQQQEAAIRIQVRREEVTERKQEAALRSQMEVARRRMEVDAQKLAALSAQMYGPMMQRLARLERSPHALIGVQLESSGDTAGARVREVSPGGPAERAGIRAGDLIVAVNGTHVSGRASAGRVMELLRGVKPGDKVAVSVLRDGKTRDLTVTARPDWEGAYFAREFAGLRLTPGVPLAPLPPGVPLPPMRPFSSWEGGPMIIRGPVADMSLARLSQGLGSYFGTDSGVLVVRAPPGGGLGLKDGDVILSIGGRKPIDSSHVIRILSSYDPGEKISMEVMRQHRQISVTATMPSEPSMPRGIMMMRKGSQTAGPVITVRP